MAAKNPIFFVTLGLGLIIDQASKFWVQFNIPYRSGEIELIPGFLSIIHDENPGAMMGFLRDAPYRQWIFLGFTLIAVGVLFDLFQKLAPHRRFHAFLLGMLTAGALGNAIDRVHKSTVTDFISVYTDHPPLKAWLLNTIGLSAWHTFNVADSYLVVGVILFTIFGVPEGERASKPLTHR